MLWLSFRRRRKPRNNKTFQSSPSKAEEEEGKEGEEEENRDVTWESEVWVNMSISGVCVWSIYPSRRVCARKLQIWKLWLHSPFSSFNLGGPNGEALMGLVPFRSMQISSTLFRHERWDATNRNQREAALARAQRASFKKRKENQRQKIWHQVSPV